MINSHSGGCQPPRDSWCVWSAGRHPASRRVPCPTEPRARFRADSSPRSLFCQGLSESELAVSTLALRELRPSWPKESKAQDLAPAGSGGTGLSLPESSANFTCVHFRTGLLRSLRRAGEDTMVSQIAALEGQAPLRAGGGQGASGEEARDSVALALALSSRPPRAGACLVGTREMGEKWRSRVLHSCFCQRTPPGVCFLFCFTFLDFYFPRSVWKHASAFIYLLPPNAFSLPPPPLFFLYL